MRGKRESQRERVPTRRRRGHQEELSRGGGGRGGSRLYIFMALQGKSLSSPLLYSAKRVLVISAHADKSTQNYSIQGAFLHFLKKVFCADREKKYFLSCFPQSAIPGILSSCTLSMQNNLLFPLLASPSHLISPSIKLGVMDDNTRPALPRRGRRRRKV